MALGAHFINRREPDKMLVLSAVRPMAAQACYGYVPVPRIEHLFTDRMAGVVFPVVAFSADIDHRRLLKEEVSVRGMRIVADSTIALIYWNMFGLGTFLSLYRIVMTRIAEHFHRRSEKFRFCRGMGVMTVQTALLAYYRPMELIFPEHIIDRITMASPAEFVP